MFEIALPIAATSGIVALARGRGGKPWVWGTLAVLGYFAFPAVVAFFAAAFGADPASIKGNSQLWFFVSAAAWIGILTFCARFLLGRGYAKPDGMWSRKNCKYLNKQYAVICEACREPYASKALPFS
jgi:hypothetical protein